MLSCSAGGLPVGHKGMDGRGPEQKAVFRCGEVASRGTVHQLLLQLQFLGFCSWVSVLGLCSGSPYCKQKASVGLSMYICIKHLLRRSVKNSEAETLTLLVYTDIIWK